MRVAGRRRGFKSWFVEPYRQVKLGLVFLVINILFSCLILGLFGYYLWDMYQSISLYFSLSSEQGAQALSKFAVPAIAGTSLILLFMAATILTSVKYTHQIYGPLVSIHRFLDDVTEGREVEPLQLRQSDQLKELANKLNLLAERLNTGRRQAPLMPVYRYLDELLAGRIPTKLKLRDSDHLNELVEKLNQLGESMASKV